jgi:hypothetical protein
MPKNPEQDFEDQVNQGEGNQTAARDYDEKATEHARSGKSDEAARDAEKAVEGAEGRDLEEAEEEGKSHIAEEDPEIRQ